MSDKDVAKKSTEDSSSQQIAPPARNISLAPVPMSWSISQARGEEGTLILVYIQTAEGDKMFFLNPSVAKQIADALLVQASAAESGLTES